MYDPRKSRSQENLDASPVKTAALFAALSYGSVKLLSGYTKIYEFARKAVTDARENVRSLGSHGISQLFTGDIDVETLLLKNAEQSDISDLFNTGVEAWDKHVKAARAGTGSQYTDQMFYSSQIDNITQWAEAFQQDQIPGKRFTILGKGEVPIPPEDLNNLIRSTYDSKFKSIVEEETSAKSLATQVEELAQPRATQHWNRLEKLYPTMKATFDEMERAGDIKVEKVTWDNSGYYVHIRDAGPFTEAAQGKTGKGKIHKVFFPDWSKGDITRDGVKYRIIHDLELRGGNLEAKTFGTKVVEKIDKTKPGFLAGRVNSPMSLEDINAWKAKIKKVLGKDASDITLGTDKALLLKNMIDRTIAINTSEYAGGTHEAAFLAPRFRYTELLEPAKQIYSKVGTREFGYKLQRDQGKPIVFTHMNEKGIITQDGTKELGWLWNTPHHLDITSISEQASLKAKVSTDIPIWKFMHPTFTKQSQQRLDWAVGVPLSGIGGAKLTKREVGTSIDLRRRKITAAIGPVAGDVADAIAYQQETTIPGRMANTAFVFEDPRYSSDGMIKGIGDGGAVMIARKKAFVPGALNIDDWNHATKYGNKRVLYKATKRIGAKGTPVDTFESSYNALKKKYKDMIETDNRAVLKEDVVLGVDPETMKEVRLNKGTILTSFAENEDSGIATVNYVETGSPADNVKMVHGKMINEKLVYPDAGKEAQQVITRMFPEKAEYTETITKLLNHGYAGNSAEFFTNAGAMSKHMGGGIGVGIFTKTLQDIGFLQKQSLKSRVSKLIKLKESQGISFTIKEAVEELSKTDKKALMNTARILLGDDAVDIGIKSIEYDNSLGIAVSLKDGVDTGRIDVFGKMMGLEEPLFDGDWKTVIKRFEHLEKKIRTATGIKHYDMLLTNDEASIAKNLFVRSKGAAGVFPTVSVMKDEKGAVVRAMLTPRLPQIIHSATTSPLTNVARATRTLSGYTGGVRVTMDHIRNASMAGLPHYVRYLSSLRDYNMTYLENKISSANNLFLTEKDLPGIKLASASNPRGILIGKDGLLKGKKARVLDLPTTKEGMLMKSLTDDFVTRINADAYIDYHVVQQDLGKRLHSYDLNEALARGQVLTLDDLVANGEVGMRGNSVATLSETSMKMLHEAVNIRNDDEVVLLKLPSEYDIFGPYKDKTAKSLAHEYVTLHDFDYGDVFELQAMESVGHMAKKRYFTGSEFFSNQARFISAVAKVNEELRQGNLSEQRRKQIFADLQAEKALYKTAMANAFSGKTSIGKRRAIEVGIPFSTFGQLRTMDEHIMSSVMGGPGSTYSRQLFSKVGVHKDTFVGLVSQGKYHTMEEVTRNVDLYEGVTKIAKRAKGLQEQIETLDSMDVKARELFLSQLDEDVKIPNPIKKVIGDARESLNEMQKASPSTEAFQNAKKTLQDRLDTTIKISGEEQKKRALAMVVKDTIDGAQSGSRVITARIQGYPDLSPMSGAFVQVVPIDGTTIDKTSLEALTKKGMKAPQTAKNIIYTTPEMAESIARDFDGDNLGLVLTSLDTLDEFAGKYDMVNYFTKSAGIDHKLATGMTAESVSAMIESTLVTKELSDNGYPINIKPANASALSSAYVAENVKYGEFIEFETNIRKHLTDKLAQAGLDTKSPEIKEFIDTKLKDWRIKNKQMTGGKEIVAITGFNNVEDIKDRIKTPPEATDILKKQPDRFHEYISGMTDTDRLLYEKLTDATKRDMAEYQDKQARGVQRYIARKYDTAKSYKVAETLMYLGEADVKDNERLKTFLYALTDKTMTQHTLNQKHGTPLIMEDFLDRMKVIMNPTSRESERYLKTTYKDAHIRGGIPEQFFEDLASGNLLVNALEPDLQDMEKYGYIKSRVERATDKVHMDSYQKYLVERAEFSQVLIDAHMEVGDELIASQTFGEMAEQDIRAEHAERIRAKIASHQFTKGAGKNNRFLQNPTAMDDVLLDASVANEYLHNSRAAVENIKYRRDADRLYIEDHMASNFSKSQAAQHYKELAILGQTWKVEHGASIFENQIARATRDYISEKAGNSRVYNILDSMMATHQKLIQRKAEGHQLGVVSHLADRFMTGITNFLYGTNIDIQRHDMEARKVALNQLREREGQTLSRAATRRISAPDTIFKQGSLLETLAGRINRVVGAEGESALLNKMRRTRVGALITGLFVGAFAGQVYNQVANGYAVPDLKHTKGLGGEYFENTSGIMGREMEAMMSPRPPKVVPWYGNDMGTGKDMESQANMSMAMQRTTSLPNYSRKYRGVVL